MIINMKRIIIIFIFFQSIIVLNAQILKVAAVQLEISEFTYSSHEQFQLEMEKNVRQAMETFQPDLIIFPEYTSVFPASTAYFDIIGNSKSMEEILQKIHGQNRNISSLYDLFIHESVGTEELLTFWGDLAKKYSVYHCGWELFCL